MTKSQQFKLVAKILKQYAPGSEDRLIAGWAIDTFKNNYINNPQLLKLKLETLVEETV
jgi:hypothetical protein|tara:strand:- start:200 stop:373 length:174 start_codon:yes stop_codon:yes gene_type:complete